MTIDYHTQLTTIEGETTDLTPYEGHFMLIVNVASQCGLTPQYRGLQRLHEQFSTLGLRVLGFPCNQFGQQEPGTEGEIALFCETSYGVSFPMFSKVQVNGPKTHPLWRQLKDQAPGLLGSRSIKWNFTKFLVGPDGEVLKRYAPQVSPATIAADLDDALRRDAA